MKGKIFKAAAFGCAVLCALGAAGCAGGTGECTLLGKPEKTAILTDGQRMDKNFVGYVDGIDVFSSKLAAEAVKANAEENFSVSPISAYMALALAADCAAGDTKTEILQALNTDYTTLSTYFGDLYNLLNVENRQKGKLLSALNLTNSLWMNEWTEYKQTGIESLSQKFYAYSYRAPFLSDNAAANDAVQSFVKDKTKGLIDVNFDLPKDTAFALVNTLYWKDVWNYFGEELEFSDLEYNFKNADGTSEDIKFLQANYLSGNARDFGNFKSFYAQTCNGYKLKFIVPDDGVSAREVFTAENIAAVNAANFAEGSVDEENKSKYYTRCVFPEFSVSCNINLKDVLSEKFGINKFFDRDSCNFSNLTDQGVFCDKVQHVTRLKIDKKGGEGAAVTVEEGVATAPAPEYFDVYRDFLIDKAFGFILTDINGVQLFAGIFDKI